MENARIYTYSIIYAAPVGFEGEAPYVCAILENDEGKRVLGRLGGYRDGIGLTIGQAVIGSANGQGDTVYSIG